jgi:hypothetical protein
MIRSYAVRKLNVWKVKHEKVKKKIMCIISKWQERLSSILFILGGIDL